MYVFGLKTLQHFGSENRGTLELRMQATEVGLWAVIKKTNFGTKYFFHVVVYLT